MRRRRYAHRRFRRNRQNGSEFSLKTCQLGTQKHLGEVRKMFGNLTWGTERIRTFSEHPRGRPPGPSGSTLRPPGQARDTTTAHYGPQVPPRGPLQGPKGRLRTSNLGQGASKEGLGAPAQRRMPALQHETQIQELSGATKSYPEWKYV